LIVVINARTFVSTALKANSIPERALLRAVDPPNRLIFSHEVEDEYREVILRPKFDRFVSVERRQRILDIVVVAAERIEPTETVRECRDPTGDKYLALAAAGRADVIVSSDARHLLSMHPWRGIRILSPANPRVPVPLALQCACRGQNGSLTITEPDRSSVFRKAGLDPAIHAFGRPKQRRGCADQVRTRRLQVVS
jgi:putative PIN family toxin of toxin-antitoxin system